MSDHTPFLRQILEDPEDDGARLVYADWLEEQGNPRGEFIQVQCELARPETRPTRRRLLRKRERELFQEHGLHWMAENGNSVRRPIYRRGFLDEATITLRSFIKHSKSLFATVPLQRVTLTAGATLLAKLATLPELARIRSIRLKGNGFDDAGLIAFSESEFIRHLERLILTNQEIHRAGLAALAACPNFTSLHSLDLSLNNFSTGIEALFDSPLLPRLKAFSIRGIQMNLSSFRRFCQFAPLKKLEFLDCSFNFERNSSLGEIFVESQSFPELQHACFNGCNLSSIGLRQLARVQYLPNLKVLELRWNDIDDAGVIALAESPLLCQLERISLNGNRITRRGAEALGSSPHLPKGIDISLSNNRIRNRRDIADLREQFGRSFGKF